MQLTSVASARLLALRGPRLYLAGLALLSVAACFLPLADHLGYELAELVALYAGLFGAAPGIAAARRERARQREGRPASALVALLAALGFSLAALCLPVAISLLNGARRPSCDRLSGLILFAALPLPSALLASALGVACGFFSERLAGPLAGAVFAVTLTAALWPLAFGPQVFAFHHLGGMFPGPIYDEAVRATAALWWFRGCTLLYAGACAGLALLLGPAGQLSSARGPRAGALAMTALFGAGALGLSLQAERLHWKSSVSLVDGELGGRIETAHLVLHVPREKPAAERSLLAQQAEADLRTVRLFLGLPATPAAGAAPIEVFLYRSADEKRRLLGAADTSFTKPWLSQIHTNDEPLPHHILRHELAHAAGAELAKGPFRVPGRLRGLLPDMALIEGLAVAADWPGGEFTLDEEARALRELSLLPSLPALFQPGLFYAESGARAYAYAGSFVRWLWRTRGAATLARAYAGEPLEKVYGDLAALAQEHGKFLDQTAASKRALLLLGQRFRAPSIVRKRCPHEVADLTRQAQLVQGSDAAKAAALWRSCTELEPDDPNLLAGLRRAELLAGHVGEARAVEERLLAHPKLGPAQRASLLIEAGDAAWRAGEQASAQARYAEAAALPQPEAQERALQARVAALADRDAWPAARRLLADGDQGPLSWLLLARWAQSRPDSGLPRYLLGKQLQNHGDWEECARLTAEALARKLPGPLFVEEALRMSGLAAWHLGDAAAARAAFTRLGKGASPGRQREAEDWLSRLQITGSR